MQTEIINMMPPAFRQVVNMIKFTNLCEDMQKDLPIALLFDTDMEQYIRDITQMVQLSQCVLHSMIESKTV